MRTALLVALCLLSVPQLAAAQGTGRAPGPQTRVAPVPKQAPPPALPGARAEPTNAAPAEKTQLDLPPNEALFDAINRGDLGSAQDSVNRGADLEARNVLGLTPLELAVDLGRNQISFLLLSLRGGAGYSSSGKPPDPAKAGRQTRAQRAAAVRAERVEQQESAGAAPVAARAPREAAMAAPPRFAGNGGTPVPASGFMGFDANARR